MSVLDGFYSTWKNARETFGAGIPETGDHYDRSNTLSSLQSGLKSAEPGSRWTGAAATNYNTAHTEHGRVIGELAGLDQRLKAHIDQSAHIVANGRRDLDNIHKWVTDAANSVPQGANRDQALMPIAHKGLTQLQDVVNRSNGELNTVAAGMGKLNSDYQALGTGQKFGGDPKEGPQFTTAGNDRKDQPPADFPRRGQPVAPADPFIGDERFGHWENVPPAPPYVGAQPPPLKNEFRRFADDSPLKVGPTTGMYTPGKTWIGDIDPPAVQGKVGYRFRMAGQEATTHTRMVNENGVWREERWVQNVYEYQRNTSVTFGGDIGVKGVGGKEGDIGGLPPVQNIDRNWKPISLPQIAVLSANNPETTYYLPDGCGGTVNFNGGVAPDPSSPPPIPSMTRPR